METAIKITVYWKRPEALARFITGKIAGGSSLLSNAQGIMFSSSTARSQKTAKMPARCR